MSQVPSARRSAPAINVLPRQCRARLGLVVLAGATAISMLGTSLVSMDVASVRMRLAAVDRRMTDVQGERDALATELGICAGPVRLDRLNASTLRLRSPQPRQYLAGVAALQQLARPMPTDTGAPLLAYDLPTVPARAAL